MEKPFILDANDIPTFEDDVVDFNDELYTVGKVDVADNCVEVYTNIEDGEGFELLAEGTFYKVIPEVEENLDF